MDKKYLRKNEFRYDTNPRVRNKKNKGHVAYVSVTHGNRSKVNIITHSGSFFGESTKELSKNPQIDKKDKRKARVSVPRWEENRHIQGKPFGTWHLTKKDRSMIRKINRNYKKKK